MSSLLLAVVVLFIVPLLLGTLWNRIWKALHISKTDKNSMPGNYLPGVFLLLCFFEGIVILSMKLDMPFSKVVFMVSIFLLVLCGVACVFCQRELKELLLPENENKTLYKGKRLQEEKIYIILFLIVFILQIFLIFHFAPVTADDNTMEVIQTTLTTDTIGMYDPLTGQPYETGLTLQGKLMSLPVFYAYMIRIFSADQALFLYRLIPIWVLFMSYTAYSLIADELFQSADKENKKQLFLFFYGVLLLFGGYLFTTPGYQLIHGSWKGETIVVTVIIPYLIGLGMHWKQEKIMTAFQGMLTIFTVIPLMRWRKGMVYIAILLVVLMITGLWIGLYDRYVSKRQSPKSHT